MLLRELMRSLRRSIENYCQDKRTIVQWLRAFYIYGDDDFGNSMFEQTNLMLFKCYT